MYKGINVNVIKQRFKGKNNHNIYVDVSSSHTYIVRQKWMCVIGDKNIHVPTRENYLQLSSNKILKENCALQG